MPDLYFALLAEYCLVGVKKNNEGLCISVSIKLDKWNNLIERHDLMNAEIALKKNQQQSTILPKIGTKKA